MTIIIKFCGGAQTVTGSMHLIATEHSRILIDVGLFHGRRDEFYTINSTFPFDPSNLDACIISHAHIDHCGNFPTLAKQGFKAKVYMTPSTKELCDYMLPDSGYIQEEDIKYVNKINRRRGLPLRYPLYTQLEAKRCLKFFKGLDYHKKTRMTKDIDLTFYDSGHILGASIPTLDIHTDKSTTRIAYAVDLGRPDLPFLRNPELPGGIDYLIIESTYGNKNHAHIDTAEAKLEDAINRTLKRGGKVIIPAFALERTQEVLYFLSRLLKDGKIKNVPIYVDSPLAVNITKVFRDNAMYFDEETRKMFKKEQDPFVHKNIIFIKNVNQSKRLNNKTGPMVIISASGMCEHGRILHHLKNNIENPYNTIIIVGYMAKDTLGRKLVEKNPIVNIFGRPYERKAEVVVLDAFSAHADKDFLAKYVSECSESVKEIFIVHGEPEQSEALRDSIKSLNVKVKIPYKGEEVYLAAAVPQNPQ